MPVIRPGPAERAQAICGLLEENGVPGYRLEMDPAYHRANALEYIASPPGNWPYISVDCRRDRAIVMTRDFDPRQTRSFCLFLPADLTALVAHVKHLHETSDDSPGPLEQLARAIADRFRQHGLDVMVMNHDAEHIVQAFDTRSSPPDKFIRIGIGGEDFAVRCDVSELGGCEGAEEMWHIYDDTCDLENFDPETVIPRLVARLLA
jgi:hypothetical protein